MGGWVGGRRYLWVVRRVGSEREAEEVEGRGESGCIIFEEVGVLLALVEKREEGGGGDRGGGGEEGGEEGGGLELSKGTVPAAFVHIAWVGGWVGGWRRNLFGWVGGLTYGS